MTANTPGNTRQRPPQNVRLEEDGVHVDWADEHEGFYPYRYLRSECPCAHCVEEMTGRRMVFLNDIEPDVFALDWIQIGNYAISFLFSAAHDTGIYTFQRLKEMCQCDIHDKNSAGTEPSN